MTSLGWFLFILLLIMVVGSMILINKYLTSIFNKKYFLFFIIFGSAIISALFIIPKTYTSLILESDIEIADKVQILEKSKSEYANQKKLIDKLRIKQLKKESKTLKKQLKKEPDEEKQLKYSGIVAEIERIPGIKSNVKNIKKSIRKQNIQLKSESVSMLVKRNRFVIFVCFSSLIFIFIVLYVIGTIKKPAMIKEYEAEVARFNAEEERKRKEKEADKERKRNEKIYEIANYLFTNNLNFLDVQNAYQIVNEYEKTVSSLKKEIHHAENTMSESILDVNDLFEIPDLIGKKNRAKKSFNMKSDQLENFEEKNKSLYLQKKSLISAFPKQTSEFCEKYGAEIINCINELINKAKKEEEELKLQEQKKEQERIKRQEQAKMEEFKAVDDNRKIANELSKKIQNEEDCSKKIKELGNFTALFQKSVFEKKRIDFGHLNVLEEILDKIEDLRTFIPESDINNIERSQKKILASFENAENINDVQVNIDIIKESFEKILAK